MTVAATTSPDVTIIITAHREGRLAHHSVQSAQRTAEYARSRGVSVELMASLDCSDDATIRYFQSQAELFAEVLEVDVVDLGLSRNAAVQRARGRYVCFLDADDLFSENWVEAAYRFAEARPSEKLVLHPELNLLFGAELFFINHPDSTAESFSRLNLLEYNYWSALCFVSRELFLQTKGYAPSDIGNGLGYEDWHWNCQALQCGFEHRAVPQTAHFIRGGRNNSLSQRSFRKQTMIRPTEFFDQLARDAFLGKEAIVESLGSTESLETVSLQLKPRYQQDRWFSANWVRSHTPTWLHRYLKPPYRMVRRTVPLLRARAGQILARCKSIGRSGRTGDILAYTSGDCQTTVPQWLVDEWRNIHAIEPSLFPTKEDLAAIQEMIRPTSKVAHLYPALSAAFGSGVTHVVIVPWLNRGGADMVALNHIRVLAATKSHRVVCITTEDADSPWLAKLPETVKVLEVGKYFRNCSQEQQQLLLTRLLLQKQPEVIHNINSDLCYRIFCAHGGALATYSRLYASVFSDVIEEDGRRVGHGARYLRHCFPDLSHVFNDNSAYRQQLIDTFAFDEDKLTVIYHPVPKANESRRLSNGYRDGAFHVMWAGRFDRDKRPDVLYEIASRLMNEDFVFHVYGAPLLDNFGAAYHTALGKLPNVKLCGQFGTFFDLPTHEMHAFLYTSQSDGMPLTPLEAASAGLPVLAPDVGGVREFINEATGFLMSSGTAVEEYVECLRHIRSDYQGLAVPRIRRVLSLIEERHTPEAFAASLQRVPGYMHNSAAACDNSGRQLRQDAA